MARRTNRRPKVVWLPIDTTNRLREAGAAAVGAASAGWQIGMVVSPTTPSLGGGGQTLLPVVKDEPQNITGAAETLSDLEGSAYRLRRIVGKIFVQPTQQTTLGNVNNATSWMFTAGFMILRVDDNGAPLAGAAFPYDPQSLNSTRDPWIWRRSWCLSDQAQINSLNTAIPDTKQLIFPSSNINGYGGGVLDGPHIDAKTARVVSDEERLFLILGAVALDGNSQGDDSVINCFGEVRVLASMRSQSGNRRNASR